MNKTKQNNSKLFAQTPIYELVKRFETNQNSNFALGAIGFPSIQSQFNRLDFFLLLLLFVCFFADPITIFPVRKPIDWLKGRKKWQKNFFCG